jgi:hypothetical protein
MACGLWLSSGGQGFPEVCAGGNRVASLLIGSWSRISAGLEWGFGVPLNGRPYRPLVFFGGAFQGLWPWLRERLALWAEDEVEIVDFRIEIRRRKDEDTAMSGGLHNRGTQRMG